MGVAGQPEAKQAVSKNLYTRNGVYWARFKVRGVEYRESLRTRSSSVATKRLKARKQQVEDQAHFGISGPRGWMEAVLAWTVAMEQEIRNRTKSDKTVKRYATSLNEVRPWLDKAEVHEIDQDLLREMVKGRHAQRVTNATIRRDLTAIASVLDVAIDEGWIEENAASDYPRKRLQERRDPIVLPTPEAITLTIGRQRTRFGDMMLLARETGMREEEIASLEHTSVDLAGRHATIVGKRNRLRTVTLSTEAIAIIKRQPRYLGCPFVFWHQVEDEAGRPVASRYNNVASNFADYTMRAEKRAIKQGVEYRRFRFHDLRHMFAVEYLREGRGGIYDLQRELGHGSVKTTEIYLDFLTPEQAAQARVGVAQKRAQRRKADG
ncbi:tyrosine-type recombinase/integrase [Sphingomonas sp.]|uniref:tyrosine-type recombinase/integrase n=1 Tax=Sphingomonas sp. TaxID=28214 RepID=UPI003B3B9406